MFDRAMPIATSCHCLACCIDLCLLPHLLPVSFSLSFFPLQNPFSLFLFLTLLPFIGSLASRAEYNLSFSRLRNFCFCNQKKKTSVFLRLRFMSHSVLELWHSFSRIGFVVGKRS